MTKKQQPGGYGLPAQADAEQAAAIPSPDNRRPRWLQNLRGDLTGGSVAALLTIPIGIGYALLALAPLGESAVPHAILAGLYAPVLGCLVALALGANTTMIYSSRSVTTFLIGSFVLHDLTLSSVSYVRSADPALLLTLAFLLILLTGSFQALFGLLKLGSLLKYIPAPVTAGFQNAAAFLLFTSQLDVFLGLPQRVPLLGLPANAGLIQPLTVAVGVLTCFLVLRGARITKRVPPTILGLLGGITAYFLLFWAGFDEALGKRLGNIDVGLPSPHYLWEFGNLFSDPLFLGFLPIVVLSAASVAVISSLDAVLCARSIQADSGNRFDGNRELVRLGAGNMVAACFGGIANGINLASSFANHRAGGRTPLSVLFHAMVILFVVQAMPTALGQVPRVVIAALLVVVAIQLVDRWTLQIIRKLVAREIGVMSSTTLDLLVILLVATVAIATNLFIAVMLGVMIAVVFFLLRMSRSVIRRTYRCDKVHSRKTRAPGHMEVLSRHGDRIVVLELEGPLFFGTADKLAAHVDDALHEDVDYAILDLNRVNELDSTGAQIIMQLHDRITKQGKHLLMSSVPGDSRLGRVLWNLGITATLGSNRIFVDLDRAIEWAEDHLILSETGRAAEDEEFAFAHIDAFSGMSEEELATMRSMLTRRTFGRGETVFQQGDESRELYIIAKGSASARLRLPGTARETRLITFTAGTVFGEMALLDREARSATIAADDDLVCYVLDYESFESLARDHPRIVLHLLANLSRELAARLRRANRTIQELAS